MGRGPIYSKEELDLFRRYWAAGKEYDEMSVLLGRTVNALTVLRHTLGLKPRPRGGNGGKAKRRGAKRGANPYLGPVQHRPAVLPPQMPGWPTREQLMARR